MHTVSGSQQLTGTANFLCSDPALTSTRWFLRILRMHMSGWVAGTPLSSGLGKFMELARCSPMSSAPKLPEPEPLLLVWRRPTAAAWGGGGCRCWGSRAAPLVVVARWLCNRLADTSRATIWRSSAACECTKQECCSCFTGKKLGRARWQDLAASVVLLLVHALMHFTAHCWTSLC